MPDEPEEGFTFRDRRRVHSEPSSRPEPTPESTPPPPAASQPAPAPAPAPAAPPVGAAPPSAALGGSFFGAPPAEPGGGLPFGGDVAAFDTGELPADPSGMPADPGAGGQGDIPDVREYMVEFLMMLRSLAAIRLGLIPNPATGRPEKDLEQARLAIDTVTFLVQQLEPSVAPQERLPLRAMVSDLRLRYVEETRGGA